MKIEINSKPHDSRHAQEPVLVLCQLFSFSCQVIKDKFIQQVVNRFLKAVHGAGVAPETVYAVYDLS